MAKDFSFDVVSRFDIQEMNNVVDQAQRDIANRYDFKGTAASVSFTDDDKNSLVLAGDNQYQIDAIVDILRKKSASRGVSQKAFDVSAEPVQSGMELKMTVPLVSGLDKEKVKTITKLLRDELPKVKTQVIGDEVRVSSSKKDVLQSAMTLLKQADLPYPLSFTNYH